MFRPTTAHENMVEMQDRPWLSSRRHSTYAYAPGAPQPQGFEPTPAQLEAGLQVQEPCPATVAPSRQPHRQRSRSSRPQGADRGHSGFSIASSDVSITEVPPSDEILAKGESHGLGTYRYIIAGVTRGQEHSGGAEGQPADSIGVKFGLERLDCADDQIAAKEQLQQLADEYPMPEPRHGETHNQIRYRHFAVYQRLFAIVIAINMILIIAFAVVTGVKGQQKIFTYADALTAVSANILGAQLMRQEHCINMLFRSVLSLPHSWSVKVRRHAAKIYCHGGVHSACGVSSMGWYIFFAVLVQNWPASNAAYKYTVLATSVIILLMFGVLTIGSIPWFRARFHNQWELMHRYSGWTTVAIVWVQLFCISASNAATESQTLGILLVKTPSFWMLVATTLLLIYPWLFLRKVTFVAEKLSTHATQLHFDTKKVLPTCAGIALSGAPFVENHKFATIPEPDKQPGFSVLVANNGDWTKKLVDNPPQYLWTRGVPALGVARIAKVFRRVVLVATGSGIGPCLSLINVHPEWAMRIVWSARLPLESYGKSNIQNILRADKGAIIIDTKKTSYKEEDMPSLVKVTYAAYQDFDAEAVIVISNPAVTHEIVYNLEKRKIPAYGAIWDS
ncbi:hypothetical protein CKM354_001093200 [Cercospora kikuchii]|uniref:Integral membrane protein TmpA n=1 Tax=Cercospora kikuchii TaxID=84275 RepID=A0A9P3FK09_9PEZI|nr:uncharacterized protein CKM354_001093200 [Cercospora kikuchii]GIZ47852.1 hypothetical protein CKM354_001093200 [Cercospora kikuchii]